jgi:hypothetical protein
MRGSVVLIAPSGAGKTMELRELSRRLRAAGEHAVFADACGVVAHQAMDLDQEEKLAFERIHSSSCSNSSPIRW